MRKNVGKILHKLNNGRGCDFICNIKPKCSELYTKHLLKYTLNRGNMSNQKIIHDIREGFYLEL